MTLLHAPIQLCEWNLQKNKMQGPDQPKAAELEMIQHLQGSDGFLLCGSLEKRRTCRYFFCFVLFSEQHAHFKTTKSQFILL